MRSSSPPGPAALAAMQKRRLREEAKLFLPKGMSKKDADRRNFKKWKAPREAQVQEAFAA